MSDLPKYAFKGVWIPKEIWESKAITWMEKCLLADIDALDDDDGERACFASNEYFAQKFGSSAASIANQISKLRKLGFVETIGFDGRERNLRLTSRLKEGKPMDESRVNRAVKAPIGEDKAEKETPSPAKAGNGGSDEPSINRRCSNRLPTSPEAIRVTSLFGRQKTTEWSDKEIRAFKKLLPIDINDLSLLETYYAFERQKQGDGIHRRNLITFLNNYYGELDRARAWRENPKANEKKQSNGNGHNANRNSGTFNEPGAPKKRIERLSS